MPIDPITIAFYVGTLFALGVLHVLIQIFRWPRLRFAPVLEGPRCQACGYILCEGAESVCPECGRDGRIDQLRLKAEPPPTPPIALVLGVVATLFPLTIAAAYPIFRPFSKGWSSEASHSIQTPAGDALIWVTGDGRPLKRETMMVTVHLPNEYASTLDLKTLTLSGRRRPAMPVTRENVLRIIGAQDRVLGVIVRDGKYSSPAFAKAADEIVAELESLRDNHWPEDRFTYQMRGRSLWESGTPEKCFWLPWYKWYCVPVWIIAAVLLAWRIWRKYRVACAAFNRQLVESAQIRSPMTQ